MAVGVEVHAELLEVAHRAGRLVDEHLGGAAAGEAAAGGLGVAQVLGGRVVGGERGGDPALRPVARGLGERRRGDERDARARAGGGERGVEAGAAGADHGDVGVDGGHRGVPYPPCRRASCSPIRRRSSTTRARIPSAPRASSRSSARSSARGWLGWERGDVAGGRPRPCSRRSTRPSTSTRSSASAGAGGGALDADTVASRGHVEAALHGAGGAARDGRRCCWRGEAASRRRCTARRATTPRRARAMGFCFFNNVAVAARHALDAHGAGAGARPRLGRPPRQRDERHLPRDRRGALREHPRVAAVPGHRAGVRRRVRARARATRSTCRCRAGRATRRGARWSSTSSCRWRARTRPGSCWCRPASTPTPTTRSRRAG